MEGLRQAAMDLRLEGFSEPVAAINELAIRLSDFRWHREGASRPTATEEDSRVPAEAAQAITAIRERLESQLPAILERHPARLARAGVGPGGSAARDARPAGVFRTASAAKRRLTLPTDKSPGAA